MNVCFPNAECMPADVRQLGPRHLRVTPALAWSGSQWFYWCGSVRDLGEGETGMIDLVWPPVAQAESMAGASAETIERHTRHASFASVLPQTIVTSPDFRAWTLVPGVSPSASEPNVVRIPLRGTGREIFVATQVPYTFDDLSRLLSDVEATEPGAVREIGHSRGGIPLKVVELRSASGEDAPICYVQAYQHLTEFTGPLVADALVRWLLTPAGRTARRRLAFHILPAVDVDGLRMGFAARRAVAKDRGPSKNINRDWFDEEYTEVRAVVANLKRLTSGGRRFACGLDLHNGWSEPTRSGGCYTIFPPGAVAEPVRDTQRGFADALQSRTDHDPPGTHWEFDAAGAFHRRFYALTGCPLSFTVEFSRFKTWSRRAGAYETYAPEFHGRFAPQLAEALAEVAS
jgi:hypothetical protein